MITTLRFDNYLKNISFILSMLLLSSCSLFSPVQTDEHLYVLNTLPQINANKTHRNKVIMVAPVETSSLYNTTEMAYTTQAYQIAYFAKNKWAETPAKMLQSLIFQTLEKSHSFKSVVTPIFKGRYDYVLNTQLIELKQDFLKNPSVSKLRLQAQLTDATSGRILRSKAFSIFVPTLQNSPYGGVIAANIAAKQALVQISDFCSR